MNEYEVGVYGLREAVQEVERHKTVVAARDAEIKRLIQERNRREEQLEDLKEETKWLRSRLPAGAASEDAMMDLSKLRLKSQVEVEQLKAQVLQYEEEVGSLESERLKLKKELRVKALRRGERAAHLEMSVEKLQALEEMEAGLDDDPDFADDAVGAGRVRQRVVYVQQGGAAPPPQQVGSAAPPPPASAAASAAGMAANIDISTNFAQIKDDRTLGTRPGQGAHARAAPRLTPLLPPTGAAGASQMHGSPPSTAAPRRPTPAATRRAARVVEDAQASEVEESATARGARARATKATALRALLAEMRDEVKGMAKGVATAEGQPVAVGARVGATAGRAAKEIDAAAGRLTAKLEAQLATVDAAQGRRRHRRQAERGAGAAGCRRGSPRRQVVARPPGGAGAGVGPTPAAETAAARRDAATLSQLRAARGEHTPLAAGADGAVVPLPPQIVQSDAPAGVCSRRCMLSWSR